MKLQLMYIAGVFVAPFITNMDLEARLLEQNLSSKLTVWEVEGRACETQVQANACTVLNLQYPDACSMPILEWINAIVSSNADMVCIQGLATAENAHSICEVLQENYAHFLYVDPAMGEKQNASNLGKLLIASKYSFAAASYPSKIQ